MIEETNQKQASPKLQAPSLGQMMPLAQMSQSRLSMITTAADLGRFLKEERLGKDIALTTISNQTKISIEALKSIEEGQFANLHGDVFVRGFLRSYSECLGLDAKEVIKKYAACSDCLAPAPVSAAKERGFLALLKEGSPEHKHVSNAKKMSNPKGSNGRSANVKSARDASLSSALEPEGALVHGEYEEPQKNLLFMMAAFLMLGSIALMSYWMVASSTS